MYVRMCMTDIQVHRCLTCTTFSPFISGRHAKTHRVSITHRSHPTTLQVNVWYLWIRLSNSWHTHMWDSQRDTEHLYFCTTVHQLKQHISLNFHRRMQLEGDADRELECSVMKLAQRVSGLIMYISKDRPDLQFSSKTVMITIAKPQEITKLRLQKIARYLQNKPGLEYVLCVAERGGRVHDVSETATGVEIVRHADQQRRCWRSWETIALQVSHAPRQ